FLGQPRFRLGRASLVLAEIAAWSVDDGAICGAETGGAVVATCRFTEGSVALFSFPGCTRSTEATTATPAASAAQRRLGHANAVRKFLSDFAGTGVARTAVSVAIGAATMSAAGSARAITSRQSPQNARCSSTPSRSVAAS